MRLLTFTAGLALGSLIQSAYDSLVESPLKRNVLLGTLVYNVAKSLVLGDVLAAVWPLFALVIALTVTAVIVTFEVLR